MHIIEQIARGIELHEKHTGHKPKDIKVTRAQLNQIKADARHAYGTWLVSIAMGPKGYELEICGVPVIAVDG